MPTLRDIARAANVSIGTVSKVLNQKGAQAGISKSTQARVLEVARNLNYVPNETARNLRMGRQSNTVSLVSIGQLSSFIVSPFFAPVIHEIETHVSERGMRLTYSRLDTPAGGSDRGIHPKLSDLITSDTRAVVTIGQIPDRWSEWAADTDTVIVGVEPYSPTVQRAIYIDNYFGISEAIHHLVGCGCERLGFINLVYPNGVVHPPYQERHHAFQVVSAQLQHKLASVVTVDVTITRDFSWGDDVREKLDAMLALPLDGIVCVNDVLAAEMLRTARARNIMVPDELRITGFDNLYWTEFTAPPLTTMWIPASEIASAVVDLLMDDSTSSPVFIRPRLVVRESTSRPK